MSWRATAASRSAVVDKLLEGVEYDDFANSDSDDEGGGDASDSFEDSLSDARGNTGDSFRRGLEASSIHSTSPRSKDAGLSAPRAPVTRPSLSASFESAPSRGFTEPVPPSPAARVSNQSFASTPDRSGLRDGLPVAVDPNTSTLRFSVSTLAAALEAKERQLASLQEQFNKECVAGKQAREEAQTARREALDWQEQAGFLQHALEQLRKQYAVEGAAGTSLPQDLKNLLSLQVLRGTALDAANRKARHLETQLLRKEEALLERDRAINRLTVQENAEVASLHSEIQRLNQEIATQSAIHFARRREMNDELQQKSSELEQATTARAAAEKRCIESEDIAKRLSVRVGMLQADVDTLSKAWTSLAVELQGRDEVIGQLTGKLQQMDSVNGDLRQQNEGLQQQLQEAINADVTTAVHTGDAVVARLKEQHAGEVQMYKRLVDQLRLDMEGIKEQMARVTGAASVPASVGDVDGEGYDWQDIVTGDAPLPEGTASVVSAGWEQERVELVARITQLEEEVQREARRADDASDESERLREALTALATEHGNCGEVRVRVQADAAEEARVAAEASAAALQAQVAEWEARLHEQAQQAKVVVRDVHAQLEDARQEAERQLTAAAAREAELRSALEQARTDAVGVQEKYDVLAQEHSGCEGKLFELQLALQQSNVKHDAATAAAVEACRQEYGSAVAMLERRLSEVQARMMTRSQPEADIDAVIATVVAQCQTRLSAATSLWAFERAGLAMQAEDALSALARERDSRMVDMLSLAALQDQLAAASQREASVRAELQAGVAAWEAERSKREDACAAVVQRAEATTASLVATHQAELAEVKSSMTARHDANVQLLLREWEEERPALLIRVAEAEAASISTVHDAVARAVREAHDAHARELADVITQLEDERTQHAGCSAAQERAVSAAVANCRLEYESALLQSDQALEALEVRVQHNEDASRAALQQHAAQVHALQEELEQERAQRIVFLSQAVERVRAGMSASHVAALAAARREAEARLEAARTEQAAVRAELSVIISAVKAAIAACQEEYEGQLRVAREAEVIYIREFEQLQRQSGEEKAELLSQLEELRRVLEQSMASASGVALEAERAREEDARLQADAQQEVAALRAEVQSAMARRDADVAACREQCDAAAAKALEAQAQSWAVERAALTNAVDKADNARFAAVRQATEQLSAAHARVVESLRDNWEQERIELLAAAPAHYALVAQLALAQQEVVNTRRACAERDGMHREEVLALRQEAREKGGVVQALQLRIFELSIVHESVDAVSQTLPCACVSDADVSTQTDGASPHFPDHWLAERDALVRAVMEEREAHAAQLASAQAKYLASLQHAKAALHSVVADSKEKLNAMRSEVDHKTAEWEALRQHWEEVRGSYDARLQRREAALRADYETRLALEVSKAKREARRVTEAHMHPVAPVFTPDRARPLRDSAK